MTPEHTSSLLNALLSHIPTEFTLATEEHEISKYVWYFPSSGDISVQSLLKQCVPISTNIHQIFERYDSRIFHLGFDKKMKRYKFYIDTYALPFEIASTLLQDVQNLLGIPQLYNFESNVTQLDCLGFDINEVGSIQMKVYEIIDHLPIEFIPLIPKGVNVRESGCMKDFSGRRKYFFRFSDPFPDIDIFSQNFDIEVLSSVEKEYNCTLKRKVKYLCIEGKRKEIYFI